MDKINKGRKMIIALIVVVLLIDIITIAVISSLYATNGMMDIASYKLLQGIVRLILTILILFFLYKGHRWAKWLFVVLFSIAVLAFLGSLISSFSIIILIEALIYAFFCIMLIKSSSVNDFLMFQRNKVKSDLGDANHKESEDSLNL